MNIQTSEKREPSGVIYGKQPLCPAACVLLRVFRSGKLAAGVLTVCLGLASGCAMKKVENYRAAAPPASAGTREQNGLRFTVSPILDKKETKKYFGLDALHAGILILRLHAENRSPASTVLLRKENMTLVADRGSGQEEQSAQQIERRSRTGEALARLRQFGGGFPKNFAKTPMNSHGVPRRIRNVVPNADPDPQFTIAPVDAGQDILISA